jgi:hypothetical protein
MSLAFDLGKTYDELTSMITFNELDMWVSFYKERSKLSEQAQDDDNLANKSNEDILKGFGL